MSRCDAHGIGKATVLGSKRELHLTYGTLQGAGEKIAVAVDESSGQRGALTDVLFARSELSSRASREIDRTWKDTAELLSDDSVGVGAISRLHLATDFGIASDKTLRRKPCARPWRSSSHRLRQVARARLLRGRSLRLHALPGDSPIEPWPAHFEDAPAPDVKLLARYVGQQQCLVSAETLAARSLQGLPALGTWALATSAATAAALNLSMAPAPIAAGALPAVPGATGIEVILLVGTEPTSATQGRSYRVGPAQVKKGM